MQIVVGHTRKKTFVAALKEWGWGRMFIFDKPNPFPGELFGFDNGEFHFKTNGKEFDDPTCCKRRHGTYEQRLERIIALDRTPYIVVARDILGGGLKSLELSLEWLSKYPQDWPIYLPVQNGMTPKDVEGVIRAGWAGLFLGGDEEFKKTAPAWCELAHSFGLKFHYARAGTPDKIKAAQLSGADSLDSAFPLWTLQRFYGFRKLLGQGLLYDFANAPARETGTYAYP